MNRLYLKADSVTHAIRMKNALTLNGIYAQVVRNGNTANGRGCGYSVFADGDKVRIEAALRRNNVRFLGYIGSYGQ